MKFKKILLSVFVFIVGNLLPEARAKDVNDFVVVPDSEITYVLDMLAARIRSNYEKIRTLKGDVEFSLTAIYKDDEAQRMFEKSVADPNQKPPLSLKRINEGRIEFVFDNVEDRIYGKLNQTNGPRIIDTDTNVTYDAKLAPRKDNILIKTSEYQITANPIVRDKNDKDKVIKRGATKGPLTRLSSFNPKDFFHTGSVPIWETITRCSQEHKTFPEINGYGFKLEKKTGKDSHIDYLIQMPFKVDTDPVYSTMILTYYFSENKGFNMTNIKQSYVRSSDNSLFTYSEVNMDFSDINGVYVPISQIVFVNKPGDTSHYSEDIYTVKNIKLNESVHPDVFTYKNCNLKDGDKFIDKIENKEYRYKEATKSLELVNEN